MVLGLFRRPVFEIVEVRDRQVAFRSPQAFRHGRTVKARLSVNGSSSRNHTFAARLKVKHCRPLSDGYLHVAEVVGEPFRRGSYTRDLRGQEGLRQERRHDCRVRVLSEQLPGYQAVSVDLSPTGMQLETSEPVEPGTVLALGLDVDERGTPSVECTARVAWCRFARERSFRLGLELQDLPAEEFSRLRDGRARKREAEVPVAAAAPRAPVRSMPARGVIQACSVDEDILTVTFLHEERGPMEFRFAERAAFRDDRGLVHGACVELLELEASELLGQARRTRRVSLTEDFPLRHYRFLNAQGQPILEVVSRKVRIAFKQAS